MGNSSINCHLLLNYDKVHDKIFKRNIKRRGYIIARKNSDWTTFYDEHSRYDLEKMKELAIKFSKEFSTRAVIFSIFDSDILECYLLDEGKIIYNFSTSIATIEQDSIDEKIIYSFFDIPSNKERKLHKVLTEKKYVFEDKRLEALSKLIGIDPILAANGFNDIFDVRDLLKRKIRSKKIGKVLINEDFNIFLDAILDNDFLKVRKLIDSGLDCNWEDGAALSCAIVNGNINIINILLEAGVKLGQSNISQALYYLNYVNLRDVSSSNVKLDIKNDVDRPGTVRKINVKTNVEIVEYLYEKCPSLNLEYLFVHSLQWVGKASTEFLLQHGADINKYVEYISIFGRRFYTTPLIFVMQISGDPDFIEFLLSLGADPMLPGPDGGTFKEEIEKKIAWIEDRLNPPEGVRYRPLSDKDRAEFEHNLVKYKNFMNVFDK